MFTPVLIDEFTLFLNLQNISVLYIVCIIKIKQMEFYANNEVDDSNESDFDYDELVGNLDELELSDEDLNVYEDELNSMHGSYITDGGFTSVSLKEETPVSVFRTFFTEEIFNLISDQTNIYGKGKKQSNNQKKTGNGRM